jgi:hypothetical protein
MMRMPLHSSCKLATLVALLGLTSACATSNVPSDSITQAYAAPGIVKTQPYTRTIFSSHNF